MKRICLIASASGSGKTTVGQALAVRVGVPFYELDALHHGPNWAEPPLEEFRARVAAIAKTDEWVIDGTYRGKVGDIVPAAADLVFWLDLPMRVWLPRLLRRTARRVLRREELWSGNRERWRDALHPRNSVVVHALRTHRETRRTLENELMRFTVARVRTPDEVDAVVDAIAARRR